MLVRADEVIEWSAGEFIVLVDGAAVVSQDGSTASVYLHPCDLGDRTLRRHPGQ
jgi:hypothetical protein